MPLVLGIKYGTRRADVTRSNERENALICATHAMDAFNEGYGHTCSKAGATKTIPIHC